MTGEKQDQSKARDLFFDWETKIEILSDDSEWVVKSQILFSGAGGDQKQSLKKSYLN